jgi:hypothetical protein
MSSYPFLYSQYDQHTCRDRYQIRKHGLQAGSASGSFGAGPVGKKQTFYARHSGILRGKVKKMNMYVQAPYLDDSFLMAVCVYSHQSQNDVESLRLKTRDYEMIVGQSGNFTIIAFQQQFPGGLLMQQPQQPQQPQASSNSQKSLK